MDLRRLLPTLLILGAFGLGLLLGFALFALGGWGEASTGAAVYLLLAILGVGFGLVGLTLGAAAEEDRVRGRERRADASNPRPEKLADVMEPRSAASGTRESASPPDSRAFDQGFGDGRSAQSQPTPGRESWARGPAALSSKQMESPPDDSGLGSGETATGRFPSEHWRRSRVDPVPERDVNTWGQTGLASAEPRRPAYDEPHSLASSPEPLGFHPEELIDIWEQYEAEGDGHFTSAGLGRRLTAAGVEARAVSGKELGLGDAVLGVTSISGDGPIYVLPDFNRPSSAVSQWFEDQGSGVRTAPIKRLIKVAKAERRGGELVDFHKGIVA